MVYTSFLRESQSYRFYLLHMYHFVQWNSLTFGLLSTKIKLSIQTWSVILFLINEMLKFE